MSEMITGYLTQLLLQTWKRAFAPQDLFCFSIHILWTKKITFHFKLLLVKKTVFLFQCRFHDVLFPPALINAIDSLGLQLQSVHTCTSVLDLDFIGSDLSPKQILPEFSRSLFDEMYRNLPQADRKKSPKTLNNIFSEMSSFTYSRCGFYRIGKYMSFFPLEEFKVENMEITRMNYRLAQAVVAEILPM